MVISEHTKYSSVLGISNMDFTPADTTVIEVRPSSVRSDDISIAEVIYETVTTCIYYK